MGSVANLHVTSSSVCVRGHLQGPNGVKNVHRFAVAWKPVTREEGAKQQRHGFG